MVPMVSTLVYVMYHIHTSALTMEKSKWLRQVISPMKRWCTTISIGLPKSVNCELTMDNLSTYKEPMIGTSMQILMHLSHEQYKRYRLNAQININA